MKKITPLSRSYPSNLLEIADPPGLLYMLGEVLLEDRNAVAVIGSRKMTDYGRRITESFVREFVKGGVTVVSGGARGVDTVAHRTCLDAGGRTIAVLGNGLDVVYPYENRKLFEEIIKKGVVISEFPAGTKPLGKNFLARNRIISGLAKAVLVVEGERRSGTLSTVSYAADQGREVFAVPGPVDSRLSDAPNYLLENGARVACTPQDVLDYLESLQE